MQINKTEQSDMIDLTFTLLLVLLDIHFLCINRSVAISQQKQKILPHLSNIPALVIQEPSGHLQRHFFIPQLRQSAQKGSSDVSAVLQEGFELLEELHPLQLVMVAETTAASRGLVSANEGV